MKHEPVRQGHIMTLSLCALYFAIGTCILVLKCPRDANQSACKSEDAGDKETGFIILIREDLNIQPFADVITNSK